MLDLHDLKKWLSSHSDWAWLIHLSKKRYVRVEEPGAQDALVSKKYPHSNMLLNSQTCPSGVVDAPLDNRGGDCSSFPSQDVKSSGYDIHLSTINEVWTCILVDSCALRSTKLLILSLQILLQSWCSLQVYVHTTSNRSMHCHEFGDRLLQYWRLTLIIADWPEHHIGVSSFLRTVILGDAYHHRIDKLIILIFIIIFKYCESIKDLSGSQVWVQWM